MRQRCSLRGDKTALAGSHNLIGFNFVFAGEGNQIVLGTAIYCDMRLHGFFLTGFYI